MKKKFISISGSCRSGKDTFADYMCNHRPDKFTKMNLADPLRVFEGMLRVPYISFIIPALEEIIGVKITSTQIDDIIEKLRYKKNGEVLQLLGTEIFRNRIGQDVWCKLLVEDVQEVEQEYILIPDCRFEDELNNDHFTPIESIMMYADTPTIKRRLAEVGDLRIPFQHISEKFAEKVYTEMNEVLVPYIPNVTTYEYSQYMFDVFNTSDDDGLTLHEMEEEAINYADTILKIHGE